MGLCVYWRRKRPGARNGSSLPRFSEAVRLKPGRENGPRCLHLVMVLMEVLWVLLRSRMRRKDRLLLSPQPSLSVHFQLQAARQHPLHVMWYRTSPPLHLSLKGRISCLYVSFSFEGHDISYPAKPFLLEKNTGAFWTGTLENVNRSCVPCAQQTNCTGSACFRDAVWEAAACTILATSELHPLNTVGLHGYSSHSPVFQQPHHHTIQHFQCLPVHVKYCHHFLSLHADHLIILETYTIRMALPDVCTPVWRIPSWCDACTEVAGGRGCKLKASLSMAAGPRSTDGSRSCSSYRHLRRT
ncbi:uncharacterized protein LOC143485677 isoform X1 [Brachyhypopomus gauderio]|uniref:uncharacterized protein LOC143485677 isoform X1 n=1 Tax=Brachyhypopomus gauderio TaxID=698409 RepID=UPI0040417AD6